jgi:hypothetical protein
VPSLAGPKRPQDRVSLPEVDDVFNADMANVYKKAQTRVPVEGKDFTIGDGDVTIAAITSCTNTSNPGVLVAAGLVAKKADELGLKPKPWVKTSLAPVRRSSPTTRQGWPDPASRRMEASTWWVMAAPPASATRARWPNRSARRSTKTASSPRP